jgi:hypothetical protein
MGFGKSDPPPAPDYTGAAQQTEKGNIEAARSQTAANRVDTYTPYGDLTYAQADATNHPDTWTSNVTLAPDQQKLLDQQNTTSLNLAGMTNDATNKVGGSMHAPLPGAYDPTQATNNAAELINTRMAPQQQREAGYLDNQLANQGIMPGSEAYDTAKKIQGQTFNDAKVQAQLQGINSGQQQQAQTYNQQMGNLNTPMNQLNALRTGSQVTNPTFAQSPQQGMTAGADLLGAANSSYNAQMQGVNAQNANSGNMMSGLMSLGGMGAMAF